MLRKEMVGDFLEDIWDAYKEGGNLLGQVDSLKESGLDGSKELASWAARILGSPEKLPSRYSKWDFLRGAEIVWTQITIKIQGDKNVSLADSLPDRGPEELGRKLALCFAADWAVLNGKEPTEEQLAAAEELYPDDPDLRRRVMQAMADGEDWTKEFEKN